MSNTRTMIGFFLYSTQVSIQTFILGPSGKKLPVKLSHENADKELKVEFIPREVGKFIVQY